MKSTFDTLVSATIVPLLKKNGFSKKGTTFYKSANGLIFLINIQKSQGNTNAHVKFYINCGIHSSEMEKVIGAPENAAPKEYECYFRSRISSLVNAADDGYLADDSSDARVSADLEQVITLFQKVSSTTDLAQLMVQTGGLNNYEALFTYLLLTDNNKQLKTYVSTLMKNFGQEKRWAIFENRLNTILKNNGKEYSVSEMIAEH